MPPEQVHLLYDVEPSVLTLCKTGANRKRIFLKKELGEQKAEIGVDSSQVIRKAEGEDWSYFYCVVAEPGNLEDAGVGDGQGSGIPDMWRDAEEIRKAAHHFMRTPKLVTGLHDTLEPFGSVLENAIAQSDFEVLDPTGNAQTIKKGSWYVAVAPSDEGKAKIDNGDFTGLSLEGTGYRELAEVGGDAEKVSVLRKVAAYLGLDGQALAKESDTLNRRTEEELDVADTEKLEANMEEIRKEASATTTAVTELSGLVQKLLDHQISESKRTRKENEENEGESKPNPADLKKSIDELTQTVNTKLDELDEGVTALLDPGSSQNNDPDELRKAAREKNPLAGILD